jgi:hypothetical protein
VDPAAHRSIRQAPGGLRAPLAQGIDDGSRGQPSIFGSLREILLFDRVRGGARSHVRTGLHIEFQDFSGKLTGLLAILGLLRMPKAQEAAIPWA